VCVVMRRSISSRLSFSPRMLGKTGSSGRPWRSRSRPEKTQDYAECTIRAAVVIAMVQMPHRFRTKRQLWTYCGLALETHDSARYRFAEGQLQRRKKPATVRGLNKDHNHDLKDIFKGATQLETQMNRR
jgi:hypothetical protein